VKWVRPLITLIAVGGLTAGFFIGKVPGDAYIPLMAGTISWWFASRDNTKNTPTVGGI